MCVWQSISPGMIVASPSSIDRRTAAGVAFVHRDDAIAADDQHAGRLHGVAVEEPRRLEDGDGARARAPWQQQRAPAAAAPVRNARRPSKRSASAKTRDEKRV